MKTIPQRLLIWFATLALMAGSLSAQDLAQVRQRMAERLPAIDAMKAAGAIGENNAGYVDARETRAEVAKLAAEENADRRTVYAAIAERTGAAAAEVGRARARQIASTSASGVWLQNEKGEWYRK